jgi:hypothetical protein
VRDDFIENGHTLIVRETSQPAQNRKPCAATVDWLTCRPRRAAGVHGRIDAAAAGGEA